MNTKNALAALAATLTLVSPAFAATDGTVETIHIRVGQTDDYDEFWLTGELQVCPSLDGDWRHRVRVLRDESGHDAAIRILTAAKLSGKQVRVEASTGIVADRCVLRKVRLL